MAGSQCERQRSALGYLLSGHVHLLVLRAQIEKEARKMRRLDTIGRVAKGLCDLQTALRKTRRRWILFMVSVWFQDVSRLRQAATDLESPTLTFSL